MPNKNKAFSLIEVLIALMVLAISFGAVMALFSNTAKISTRLDQRLFAMWAAHNHALMQQTGKWPETGSKNEQVILGPYRFNLKTLVTQTPNSSFRKLKIQVLTEDKEELSSLTAYSQKDFRW